MYVSTFILNYWKTNQLRQERSTVDLLLVPPKVVLLFSPTSQNHKNFRANQKLLFLIFQKPSTGCDMLVFFIESIQTNSFPNYIYLDFQLPIRQINVQHWSFIPIQLYWSIPRLSFCINPIFSVH